MATGGQLKTGAVGYLALKIIQQNCIFKSTGKFLSATQSFAKFSLYKNFQ